MPELSPSVLVIRLDAVGDALALTPLLAELRARAIPVDLVLSRENAGIFSPAAARRIFTSPFALRSSEPANLALIGQFGSQLAVRRYSHVLVPTEDPGGYRLAFATGAPVRVGFYNGLGKPLKSLWVRRFLNDLVYRSAGVDTSGLHECESLFRLGAPLLHGAAPTRDAARLRPLIFSAPPPLGRRIAFQITDKWDRLGIPLSDVVALGRRVSTDRAVRFIASDREAPYATRFTRASDLPVERYAELESWKLAVGASQAMVAPDSGAIHLAGMIGTPTVAVFPNTPGFEAQVTRWSPWASPHRIVRANAGWPESAVEALSQLLNGTA